jgi:hypothetical protein
VQRCRDAEVVQRFSKEVQEVQEVQRFAGAEQVHQSRCTRAGAELQSCRAAEVSDAEVVPRKCRKRCRGAEVQLVQGCRCRYGGSKVLSAEELQSRCRCRGRGTDTEVHLAAELLQRHIGAEVHRGRCIGAGA